MKIINRYLAVVFCLSLSTFKFIHATEKEQIIVLPINKNYADSINLGTSSMNYNNSALKEITIEGENVKATVTVPSSFENNLDFQGFDGDSEKLSILVSYELQDEVYKTPNPYISALYAITAIYAGNDSTDFLSSIGDYEDDPFLIKDILNANKETLTSFVSRMSKALRL